ncbi:hypothetical protein EVAR_24490_1 [Eumeta japonica]|uniref:Uncharacterized protein n=1 Tax=Eumeta variegata TaxID=151549 RepID=A0A4C1WYY4_EUMVA|nr:hypothetical protein EVAR_24490_1 [Eumeta japonica]
MTRKSDVLYGYYDNRTAALCARAAALRVARSGVQARDAEIRISPILASPVCCYPGCHACLVYVAVYKDIVKLLIIDFARSSCGRFNNYKSHNSIITKLKRLKAKRIRPSSETLTYSEKNRRLTRSIDSRRKDKKLQRDSSPTLPRITQLPLLGDVHARHRKNLPDSTRIRRLADVRSSAGRNPTHRARATRMGGSGLAVTSATTPFARRAEDLLGVEVHVTYKPY